MLSCSQQQQNKHRPTGQERIGIKMKIQTTKKAIKNNYGKIVRIGYCDLQTLLSLESPFAYTAGVYGWNANIYDLNGIALVTGYRTFGDISPSLELMEKYERKAKEVIDSIYNYEERKEVLKALIYSFLEEVIK